MFARDAGKGRRRKMPPLSVPGLVALVMAAAYSSPFLPNALAYTEGAAGESTVEGVVTFLGTPPPPRLFSFLKFPNGDYCSRTDNDGKGHRVVRDVVVNDGRLQDVVVYIRGVPGGKSFMFQGTDIKISGCRFLVQGGPSTLVGVVVNGAELRVLNDDADPHDPKAITGVLHNPHSHEVVGASAFTYKNLPLPEKGQIVRQSVALRREGSIFMIYCDQHNYARAYFYPVENPYYAIVGPEGTYAIDRVPKGKYEIIGWHPTLGTQSRTVDVGESGKVTIDFQFTAPQ